MHIRAARPRVAPVNYRPLADDVGMAREMVSASAAWPVERYRRYEQLVRRLLDHVEEAGLVPGQQFRPSGNSRPGWA